MKEGLKYKGNAKGLLEYLKKEAQKELQTKTKFNYTMEFQEGSKAHVVICTLGLN